jgi:hypothetical protein
MCKSTKWYLDVFEVCVIFLMLAIATLNGQLTAGWLVSSALYTVDIRNRT